MVFLCRNIPALFFLFGLLIFILKGMKGEQFHPLDERLTLFGSATKLECAIGETNSEFTITWISNGVAILLHSSKQWHIQTERNYKSVITNDKSIAFLYISNVTFKDAGIYNCSVNFYSAGRTRRSSWIVNVQGQPQINITPLLFEKQPSMVECCVEVAFVLVMSEMEIIWRMGGEILHSRIFPIKNGTSVGMETVCSNVTLNLNRQHHDDQLQCFAKNGLNASAHVNLNVSYLANVDVIVGTFYNPSNKVDVGKGEYINITCVSHGFPSSNISLQRRTKENNWIHTPMKAYAVKQNMTMTSQTFLYNSTNENSGTFRCTANNDDLTEQSKEFQIRVHADERLGSATSQDPISLLENPGGPDGSSGPNNTQTLLIVCVGMVIVITLIVTNRSKESININPCRLKLSYLRRRGRDDSIYTDMSQGVPDVCRDPSGATQTANSVFYYVLEKDDYETVEQNNDRPVRERSENTTTVAGNAIAFYAKVNKMKIEKDANAKEMKEQQHVMDTDDETSFSNYAYVQKLK